MIFGGVIGSLNSSVDVRKAEKSQEAICRVVIREGDIGMNAHIKLDENAPMDEVFYFLNHSFAAST